jgi:hypothetical protein
MAQLSILHDKTSDWLGHDEDDDKDDFQTTATTTVAAARVEERHRIIQALQWAGILGICSHYDNDDHVVGDDNDSDQHRGEKGASWVNGDGSFLWWKKEQTRSFPVVSWAH